MFWNYSTDFNDNSSRDCFGNPCGQFFINSLRKLLDVHPGKISNNSLSVFVWGFLLKNLPIQIISEQFTQKFLQWLLWKYLKNSPRNSQIISIQLPRIHSKIFFRDYFTNSYICFFIFFLSINSLSISNCDFFFQKILQEFLYEI